MHIRSYKCGVDEASVLAAFDHTYPSLTRSWNAVSKPSAVSILRLAFHTLGKAHRSQIYSFGLILRIALAKRKNLIEENVPMLTRLSGSLLIALIGAPATQGADAETPQTVLAQFANGFSTLDVASMVKLFRPDATFFGSTVPELLRGQDGARNYFERVWTNAPRGTVTCDPTVFQTPTPDLALFATTCRLVRPEKTFTLRLSGAMLRDREGWRFADLHVSAPPTPR